MGGGSSLIISSAKAGNLITDQNNISVAFSSGGSSEQVYESTTYQNDDDNSDMQDIYNIRYAVAMSIPTGSSLIGAKPIELEVKVVKNGSPTGTAYGRIYSGAVFEGGLGTLEETSTSSYNVATLSTDDVITFEFSGEYELQANDAIALWYDNSSSSSDSVALTLRGYYSRNTDNATQIESEYNSTEDWYRETTYNLWLKLTYQ